MSSTPGSAVTQEEDAIEAFIRQRPEGVSLADLVSAAPALVGRALSERTLSRRVNRLVQAGRVAVTGAARSTRYRPVRAPAERPHEYRYKRRRDRAHKEPGVLLVREELRDVPAPSITGPRERTGERAADRTIPQPGYVPLTPEGREVWALMQRSFVERAPTGYVREFLDAYVPGETWYLPRATRARLHAVGRSPDPARPAGTYARDILAYLLIDLAWASSRLEGSTYSRLDTQNLLEFGQRAEGADAAEAQMIVNHKAALEFLVEDADRIAFNRSTLCTLHALLAENLLSDPGSEGRLRVHPVGISGTTYTPTAIPQLIEDCFDTVLARAEAIPDPFEQAFFVMVHLPYLQPFADANKRTSRLAANIPLVRGNLCPLSFVDVPQKAYVEGLLAVYELRRIELLRDVFEWAYERSCAQYRVVREAIPSPDPIRFRYRGALAEAVRHTVHAGEPPRRTALRRWGESNGVSAADLDAFAERALELLVNLHEGTAGRYRLRPSEFERWRSRFSPPVEA